jgi:glucan phosphoethanolaminetransferase (alkaline phosphatase superfamily)
MHIFQEDITPNTDINMILNPKLRATAGVLFPFLLIPLLVILDIVIRFRIIAQHSFTEFLLYGLSAVFLNEFLFWSIYQKQRCHPVLRSALILFLIISISSLSYAIYHYFGIIPNIGMMAYFIKEPKSVWTMVTTSITANQVALKLFLFFSYALFMAWQLYVRNLHSVAHRLRSYLLWTSFFILLVSARYYDQCSLPASKLVFDSINAISNSLFIEAPPKSNSIVADRAKVKGAADSAHFNILLIVNESVRRSGLSIYNDTLETTPHLKLLKSKHGDNFFQFQWGHTNSTMTYLSVPSILNGISPTNDRNVWTQAPFIWDYARAAGLYTILVSGSCFQWGKWNSFILREPVPDYCYTECDYAEEQVGKTGTLASHQMGLFDDRNTIGRLVDKLDSLQKISRNYCAVLHLYGPHYPYWHLLSDRLYKEQTLIANYRNAIYQQDKALAVLFQYLDETGLLENTVIIHTSDHGEAFGEHGYFGHLLNFYEEDIGIPIWIYLPSLVLDQMSEGERQAIRKNRDKNTSNLDILPTIIDLLDIPLDKDPVSSLGGASLLDEIDPTRVIYISNYNSLQFKTMNQAYAAVRDSLKHVYHLKNGRLTTQCFNFKQDAREVADLSLSIKRSEALPIKWDLLKNGLGSAEALP